MATKAEREAAAAAKAEPNTPPAATPASPSPLEPTALSEFRKAQLQASEPAGKRAPITAAKAGATWVVATEAGFHGGRRVRKGQKFALRADEQPAAWMQVVSQPDDE